MAATSAEAGYHEWAAFAAEQCAEKAVKALIQSAAGAARGHSVTALLQQLQPAGIDVPEPLLDGARELDQVYITARYPNGFDRGAPGEYFTPATSRRLTDHARAIFEFCRGAISGPPSGAR